MKKRVVILSLALMLVCTAGLSAFGIGLQADGNVGSSYSTGMTLTVKFDTVPLVFGFNWYLGESVQNVGVTGDYWLFNKSIVPVGDGSLNWFLGLGFFANMRFQNDFNLDAGIRIPFGLNMFIADKVFEPYIQIAPSFPVNVVPSLSMGKVYFPISAGFRIWFR